MKYLPYIPWYDLSRDMVSIQEHSKIFGITHVFKFYWLKTEKRKTKSTLTFRNHNPYSSLTIVKEGTSQTVTMVRQPNVLVYPQFGPFDIYILSKIHKRRLFATPRPSFAFSLWIFTFSSKIFLSLLFLVFVDIINFGFEFGFQ